MDALHRILYFRGFNSEYIIPQVFTVGRVQHSIEPWSLAFHWHAYMRVYAVCLYTP